MPSSLMSCCSQTAWLWNLDYQTPEWAHVDGTQDMSLPQDDHRVCGSQDDLESLQTGPNHQEQISPTSCPHPESVKTGEMCSDAIAGRKLVYVYAILTNYNEKFVQNIDTWRVIRKLLDGNKMTLLPLVQNTVQFGSTVNQCSYLLFI